MRLTTATVSFPEQSFGERSAPAALLLRLRVLLRRTSLDRRLAQGTVPAAEPELRLRALQLATRPERNCLAHSLEAILAEAEGGRDRKLYSLAIPVQQEVVLIWRDSILAIARRLESQAPVAASGVARLRLLLIDGAGPLFNPGSEYLMADVMPQIEEEL